MILGKSGKKVTKYSVIPYIYPFCILTFTQNIILSDSPLTV